MYQAGQQDNEKISFRGHENLAPRESAHVLCAGIIRHEWVGNVDLPGVLERRCSNACGLFCVWFEPGIPASRAGIPAACSRPWRTGRLRRSPPPADRSLFLHFLSLHLVSPRSPSPTPPPPPTASLSPIYLHAYLSLALSPSPSSSPVTLFLPSFFLLNPQPRALPLNVSICT